MDKYCSQCGSPIEIGDEFCSECGFKLQKSENIISKEPVNNRRNTVNKPWWRIFVVTAVLIITVGFSFYFYRKFKSENEFKDKPKTSNSEYTVKDTTLTEANENANEVKTPTVQETVPVKRENADTYLPALNKKYTYYNKYTDGGEGAVDLLVGHIDGAPLMSMSSIIPESEAFTEHVVKRDDGIFMASDYDPEVYTKYLPSEISEGASWESNGIKFQIEKTNTSCDMGFKTFENCIIVKQNFAEAGYAYKVWYAPGVGVIKAIYADSGSDYQKITSITDMNESEIKELLLRYSPNIGTIK